MRIASPRAIVAAASIAALALAGVLTAPLAASASPTPAANIKITEWEYNGSEFVEFTNLDTVTVDLTGWSFSDSAAHAGDISFSSLGKVVPGESFLLTEASASAFRTLWGLPDSVKVLGGNSSNNLGRSDAINLYDPSGVLADTLTYNDQGTGSVKGPRTDTASAWPSSPSALGADTASAWTRSTVGDAEHSWTSAPDPANSNATYVGSPGISGFGTGAAWVRINEVSSAGTDPVELVNLAPVAVDVSGWKQTDSGHSPSALVGLSAPSIPAHGYVTFTSNQGLSSDGDAVRLYAPDSVALLDSTTWATDQAEAGSWARCADGTGAFAHVTTATFGSANDCTGVGGGTTPPGGGTTAPEAPCDTEDSGTAPGTLPAGAVTWPGGDTPATIDGQCAWVTAPPTGSGQDLSGLAFDPQNPNILYAVKNKNHVYRLVKSGDDWIKDTANGWANGKDIFFPGGTGLPDSEGLTVGSDGALYITTERDNANKNVPLDSILRFDPNSTAASLSATDQWVLTDDLGYAPTDQADANLGFEGVAYVPDSFLVEHGFRTDSGALYRPSDYTKKVGAGLYFGAVEKTGHLRAYVLDSDHTYVRVADIDSGMAGVMDASFDPDLGRIWAHCDNTCGNATALLKIGTDGHFAVDSSYARPADLPNYNLEGFAVAPLSTAVNGQRQVLWTDDGNRFGHSLWAGTLNVPIITPSTLSPAPGDTITLTVSGLKPGIEYEAVLHSTPVRLGSAVANSSGVLSMSATIPASTPVGAHTITIAAVSDPTSNLAVIGITVTGRLPNTGVDPTSDLLGAALLLLAGAGALAARRLPRRRAAGA